MLNLPLTLSLPSPVDQVGDYASHRERNAVKLLELCKLRIRLSKAPKKPEADLEAEAKGEEPDKVEVFLPHQLTSLQMDESFCFHVSRQGTQTFQPHVTK